MSIFDEDIEKLDEGDSGDSGESMFLGQMLTKDKDTVCGVLMQKPLKWTEPDAYDTRYQAENRPQKTKGKRGANVAMFDKDGTAFVRMTIWDTAKTHMRGFTKAIKDVTATSKATGAEVDGRRMLYRITRKGIEHDKKVEYIVTPLRQLTADEVAMLEKQELLEIRAGAQTENYAETTKDAFAREVERIGWTLPQWCKAAETWLQDTYKGLDGVDPTTLEEMLTDLKGAAVAADPETFIRILNLDEDKDFF